MDPAALLTQAREGAGLSRTELARVSGVSRATLHRYESGLSSPVVAVLAQVLACCGRQVRAVLEPLHADLDVRVRDFVHGPVSLPFASLEVLTEAAREIAWALDGASALQAHGFCAVSSPAAGLEIALPLDQTTRTWLWRLNAHCLLPDGRWTGRTFLAVTDEEAFAAPPLQLIVPGAGFVRARLVERLPVPAVLVVRSDEQLVVPALPLHAVEQAHPLWGELLARWRELGCPARPEPQG